MPHQFVRLPEQSAHDGHPIRSRRPGRIHHHAAEGVGVEKTVGVDLERFPTQSLRISEKYRRNRIQTIFLNAKPVADPVSARLFPGDVVALSASLPGLHGATLRKGGYYAAMRRQISYRDAGNRADDTRSGLITLKLFSLPAKEIGPDIMR